jgi:hypothetical protein
MASIRRGCGSGSCAKANEERIFGWEELARWEFIEVGRRIRRIVLRREWREEKGMNWAESDQDAAQGRSWAKLGWQRVWADTHAENAKEGSTDTVPAMLTPREAGLNRNAAELAGRGAIEKLNQEGNQLAERGVDLAGGGGETSMKNKKVAGYRRGTGNFDREAGGGYYGGQAEPASWKPGVTPSGERPPPLSPGLQQPFPEPPAWTPPGIPDPGAKRGVPPSGVKPPSGVLPPPPPWKPQPQYWPGGGQPDSRYLGPPEQIGPAGAAAAWP